MNIYMSAVCCNSIAGAIITEGWCTQQKGRISLDTHAQQYTSMFISCVSCRYMGVYLACPTGFALVGSHTLACLYVMT